MSEPPGEPAAWERTEEGKRYAQLKKEREAQFLDMPPVTRLALVALLTSGALISVLFLVIIIGLLFRLASAVWVM